MMGEENTDGATDTMGNDEGLKLGFGVTAAVGDTDGAEDVTAVIAEGEDPDDDDPDEPPALPPPPPPFV